MATVMTDCYVNHNLGDGLFDNFDIEISSCIVRDVC